MHTHARASLMRAEVEADVFSNPHAIPISQIINKFEFKQTGQTKREVLMKHTQTQEAKDREAKRNQTETNGTVQRL